MEDFSIADIANWCWVRTHRWSGVSTDGLDDLKLWIDRVYEQPGMLKGLEVPVKVENLLKDKKKPKNLQKVAARSSRNNLITHINFAIL